MWEIKNKSVANILVLLGLIGHVYRGQLLVGAYVNLLLTRQQNVQLGADWSIWPGRGAAQWLLIRDQSEANNRIRPSGL